MLAHLWLGSSVRNISIVKATYIKTYAPLSSPVTLISAYFSDRYESRGITVSLVSVLAVVGFALFLGNLLCTWIRNFDARCYLGAEHKFTSYAALYLMVPGVYATPPVLAAWMANNSEPYYRRATSVALGFIAANSVCFGDEYNKFPTQFVSFRAAFWVSGVIQQKKDQNSGKQQSWISFCMCPLRFHCSFLCFVTFRNLIHFDVALFLFS